jgi:hypothetical protein
VEKSWCRSRVKLPFCGLQEVERNFSQAGQDLFVLSVLDGKREGVFLDLGCSQPILANNTYLLESRFEWNGLCIDIDERYFELFVFRKSKTLAADCRALDWDKVIATFGTAFFDYLSLDLEPPASSLECLMSIPFDRVEFAVITFEHDFYRAGDEVRLPSRELLEANGYIRLCSDVAIEGLEFEDWYYNPKHVNADRCSVLASEGDSWENVIFSVP